MKTITKLSMLALLIGALINVYNQNYKGAFTLVMVYVILREVIGIERA